MRPAIQLFTLRRIDAPLPDLLARVGDTAFEGVEFAGLGDADPAAVGDALDDAGLEAVAAHVDVADLEGDFDGVLDRHRALGCDRFVVPYLEDAHFESAATVARVARRLAELDARLAERGLSLAYHNHDHEFADVGDGTAFELLADETDVDLELDAGWATAAGHDPVALLSRYAGRVPLVHLKDVAGGRPVGLGEGDLDAEGCARAAREAGTEWLVYEHDDPDDPAASLAHGAAVLADLVE